jgi:hypothetical protein
MMHRARRARLSLFMCERRAVAMGGWVSSKIAEESGESRTTRRKKGESTLPGFICALFSFDLEIMQFNNNKKNDD